MKIRLAGIDCELMSTAEIIASGCPLIAVPVHLALEPIALEYPGGTRSGFYCSVCGQDCILAPSGQAIHAMGANPLVCFECMEKKKEA